MLALTGESAVASGWLARCERLLDDVGGDVVERGYLLVGRVLEHVSTGDLAAVRPLPEQIIAHGRRHADPNLVALGLNHQGRVLTVFGQVPEGLRRLDEAMVGVVCGEVEPLLAGEIYCSMIEACQWVGDLGRAAQWTHALSQWCDEQSGLVAFTGQCAVHRAQLMRFQGALREAVTELEHAAQRYAMTGGHVAEGLAHHERGDVLRVLGEVDAAAAAFEQAVAKGDEAQPSRALLDLDRGRVDAAVAAARRVVAETHGDIFRHRVIPGCVEVLLAGGEVDAASGLASELADIADGYGCAAVAAAADATRARVALAVGEPEPALTSARSALTTWAGLGGVHEALRCRVLVGRALGLLGHKESARHELEATHSALLEMGAVRDAREVHELLGGQAPPAGLSAREVEVLRLVAAGMSNAEIAADLQLSPKTVARHLSNIFTKLDVGSRTQAAAFAHHAGLVRSGPYPVGRD